MEIALIVPFNETFSKRSKNDFLGDIRSLEAQRIYVGEDFRFGQGRSGGLEDLNSTAPTFILPLLELNGGPVKSSRIRDLLREGELEQARLLLGRTYSARGIVQEGDKLGRLLGFPTANIEVAHHKVLPMGVFVVHVQTPGGRFGGVANVGYRPTISGRALRFEVHLFGFVGDLYGRELGVDFLTKLRSEVKFESLEALKTQLAHDAEAARKVLGI